MKLHAFKMPELSSLNRLAERVPDALMSEPLRRSQRRGCSPLPPANELQRHKGSHVDTLCQVASFLVNTITSHFEMCPFTLFLLLTSNPCLQS
jgi:hypothetical protein